MPELPEVETIRLGLSRHLIDHEIKTVTVRTPSIIKNTSVENFIQKLVGQTFLRIERHGKLLSFPLESGSLIVRLGMTGQLITTSPKNSPHIFPSHLHRPNTSNPYIQEDKHSHVMLELTNDVKLYYRDIRKFGQLRIEDETNLNDMIIRYRLGVDPLTTRFTLPYLSSILARRKAPIKAILLNQTLIAGIGNIYADEALYHAAINPFHPANELSRRQRLCLLQAIITVLKQGIAAGGTTLRDFVDNEGRKGTNQQTLAAYGRYGKPCQSCGTQLQRGTIAGRTTSWCPNCQH